MSNTENRSVCQLTSRHAVTDNRILHLMARALSRAGYRSAVVGPHDEDFESGAVKVWACPKQSERKGAWARFKAPWLLLRYALKEKEYSVFAIHDPDMIIIGVLLKWMGRRIVYDVHDNYEAAIKQKTARFGNFPSVVLSKLWWIYEKSIARFFDGVVVADRTLAAKFAWKNPVILGNAPPLTFARVPERKDDGVLNVIYVGGVTRERGVHVVLEAFSRLPHRDVRLHVIGTCSDHDILKAMEKDDRVRYYGRVPWTELPKFYANSHLGVAIYQPVPSLYDVTGEGAVKLQEYMAAGLAVITSNFPGLANFVRENDMGLVVDPEDSEAVAEGIERLYQDRLLLQRYGNKGRKAFETKYAWDLHKDKLLRLYAAVVDGN